MTVNWLIWAPCRLMSRSHEVGVASIQEASRVIVRRLMIFFGLCAVLLNVFT